MSQHDMLQQNKRISWRSGQRWHVLDFVADAADVDTDKLSLFLCPYMKNMFAHMKYLHKNTCEFNQV